jgi:hypothetical protein
MHNSISACHTPDPDIACLGQAIAQTNSSRIYREQSAIPARRNIEELLNVEADLRRLICDEADKLGVIERKRQAKVP